MHYDQHKHPDTQGYRGLCLQVPPELSPETKEAVDIAIMGGDLLMESSPFLHEVEEKAVGDFVTQIDRDIDQRISKLLRFKFPTDDIISEESARAVPVSAPLARTWIVDPLDGTSAFICGSPKNVSIMIALVEGGEARLSVIYAPFRQQLFIAEKSVGAFREGIRVVPAGGPALKEAHVGLNQYADARRETPEFAALQRALRSRDGARLVTVPPPASLLGCLAASARGIEYGAVVHDHQWRAPKQCLWDVVPVQLFVEEAGGYFGDLKGKRYDVWDAKRGPILISASAKTAAEVVALFNDVYPPGLMRGNQDAYV